MLGPIYHTTQNNRRNSHHSSAPSIYISTWYHTRQSCQFSWRIPYCSVWMGHTHTHTLNDRKGWPPYVGQHHISLARPARGSVYSSASVLRRSESAINSREINENLRAKRGPFFPSWLAIKERALAKQEVNRRAVPRHRAEWWNEIGKWP